MGARAKKQPCVYVSVLNEWMDEWTMWLWRGAGPGQTPI